MSDTRYFVCEDCAHTMGSPYFPDECEHCRRGFIVECDDLDDAEDFSQSVLDKKVASKDARHFRQ